MIRKFFLVLGVLVFAGCGKPRVLDFRLHMPLNEVQDICDMQLVEQFVRNDREYFVYSVDVDSEEFMDLAGRPYLLTFEGGRLVKISMDQESMMRRTVKR